MRAENTSRRHFHKAFKQSTGESFWEKGKKMKKVVYAIASVIFIMFLLMSTAKASLVISVTIQNPIINPLQTQSITGYTNENGDGFVMVIQPNQGVAWTNFLSSHPTLKSWWETILPADNPAAKTQISSDAGLHIVSYKLVSTMNAHSMSVVFPTDFTGVNGVPSTAAPGLYKVFFVFRSFASSTVECVELNFACGSFLVIPQVPLGTLMALVSFLSTIPAFALYRRKHLK